jgi:hypothetical protein
MGLMDFTYNDLAITSGGLISAGHYSDMALMLLRLGYKSRLWGMNGNAYDCYVYDSNAYV